MTTAKQIYFVQEMHFSVYLNECSLQQIIQLVTYTRVLTSRSCTETLPDKKIGNLFLHRHYIALNVKLLKIMPLQGHILLPGTSKLYTSPNQTSSTVD
jgi:hypothetical protein